VGRPWLPVDLGGRYGAPMPQPSRTYALLTGMRLRSALLVAVGLAVGLGAAWVWPNHTATPERLMGTVTWSNAESRRILFEVDGRGDGYREYSVLADNWVDATGTRHSRGYPDCLAAKAGEFVRTDRRRVELGAISNEADDTVRQIALSVRCFD
jgi:hypothetical protein